ncbi:iron ABC transporter permease [Reichenbachiella agarivorans]|uniref:Iron ABC transporter permease n=1 Tax=Reichenbachiella agarivorans TaxID=2979464 RepID=A0ABY6CV81_9BACT|nr:iron ABC transporter permease [Reichenbachiella agarivorans]UXP32145.1 iron ABC transporter permease [Reichenbachiella agarivorans]
MFKSILFLGLLCAALFVLNIVVGSVWIPPSDLYVIITDPSDDTRVWQNIIFNYRLPRALAALLAGASLSLSGLFMQTFFRNPLAGPFVLGISSGASLGVALVVLGSSFFSVIGLTYYAGISTTLGAIMGSFLVFLVVIYFSTKVADHTSLLIIGLMFSSATGAVVSVLQYFSNPEDIQAYLMWTFGDLGSVTMGELTMMVPLIMIGLVSSIFLLKPLNIYLIGNAYARNAGLNLQRSKYAIICVTALLAGTVTAYCGPIAFIGLAGPHIARMILDTSDHKKLIPYSAVMGSVVLLFCDMVSRLPGLAQSLPLNAITSLLGGPLVIWLIVKRKNIQSGF